MKALTLTQPWATLVAIGAKAIETRSWRTTFRGPIAIHAAQGFPEEAEEICHKDPFRSVLNAAGIHRTGELPRGAIVAVAVLLDCWQFDWGSAERIPISGLYPPHEISFGDLSPGRWGFKLANVRALTTPIPARGMLGLWELPEEVAASLRNSVPAVAEGNRNATATEPQNTKSDPNQRAAQHEENQ